MTVCDRVHLDSFKIFTAFPGHNDPLKLRLDYQAQLQDSLKVYLQKIEITFHIKLPHLISKVEQLDPSKRFSSALFLVYVYLKEGYSAQDVHAIFDMLQWLKNLDDSKLYAPHIYFGSILSESWEYPLMAFLRKATPVDEEGKPLGAEIRILPLVHMQEPYEPTPQLKESIQLIREGEMCKEFDTYVSAIKLFSGKVLGGVTAPRFFGTIYLRLPLPEEDPLLFYYESLVHECSHLQLYALMGYDPLVLNPDTERYSSPLRLDKRPMSGLYHAAFVLARILRGWRFLLQRNIKTEAVQKKLTKTQNAFNEAFETIERYGRLTDAGHALFQTMREYAKE